MDINMDVETVCSSRTNHKHVAMFIMDINLTNKTIRLWTTMDGEIKGNPDIRYVRIFTSAIRHYMDGYMDKTQKKGTQHNPIIRKRLLEQIPDIQIDFSQNSEWI